MEEPSGWHNFLEILTKPDNIPIVAMLILVIFFTWLGMKEASSTTNLSKKAKKTKSPTKCGSN
jgi:hypothetical protein